MMTKWAISLELKSQVSFECNMFGLLLTARSDSPKVGVQRGKGSHDLQTDPSMSILITLCGPQLHNNVSCSSIGWKMNFPNFSEHQISLCSDS